MGINPTAGWQANYQILPGKEKVVSELQSLAEKADTIYLATDLDREGEAIAWHLREIIGGDDSRYKRVVFNEITKTAIQEAFAQPSELNIHRVNAQQARRFLDRVVGYMVSPCSGRSWPAAFPPVGYSPSQCASSSIKSARSRRSCRWSSGISTPIC